MSSIKNEVDILTKYIWARQNFLLKNEIIGGNLRFNGVTGRHTYYRI